VSASFRQTAPFEGQEFAVTRERFSVEQGVACLKQVELGMTVADACRHRGGRDRGNWRYRPRCGLTVMC
jgi:hypothetical protein